MRSLLIHSFRNTRGFSIYLTNYNSDKQIDRETLRGSLIRSLSRRTWIPAIELKRKLENGDAGEWVTAWQQELGLLVPSWISFINGSTDDEYPERNSAKEERAGGHTTHEIRVQRNRMKKAIRCSPGSVDWQHKSSQSNFRSLIEYNFSPAMEGRRIKAVEIFLLFYFARNGNAFQRKSSQLIICKWECTSRKKSDDCSIKALFRRLMWRQFLLMWISFLHVTILLYMSRRFSVLLLLCLYSLFTNI